MDIIPDYHCYGGNSRRRDNDGSCSRNTLIGRREERSAILQYIREKTDSVLVVHSRPGDGTTTLLDHCVTHLLSHDSTQCTACHDFTAVDSTDVISKSCGPSDVSQGVIDAIARDTVMLMPARHHHHHHDQCDGGLSEKYRVRRTAAQELRRGRRLSRLTVIVVDGLDQLDDCGRAVIDWIPDTLAHNVKVIISCWSEGAAMSHIRDRLYPVKLRHSVRVASLSADDCCLILSRQLGHVTMTPTASQWQRLHSALGTAQSTLYARLLAEDVDQSDLDYVTTQQITSLPELFSYKCQSLERQLGHSVVSKCLAYVTITSTPPLGYGLTDDELVDLLSRDLDVTKDGDRRSEAFVTWRKMAAELGAFIGADEDGRRWSHVVLTEFATRRYLRTSAAKYDIYSRLADYYHAESGSESPHHPVHRLTYLPVSLQRSNRLDAFRGNVLFNVNWIYAKLRTCGLHRLLADYDRVFPAETEVSLVADALRRSEACIREDINSLALALTGRLVAYYAQFDSIRALIDACDSASFSSLSSVVPLWPCYVQAGSPLQYTTCLQPFDGSTQHQGGSIGRDALLLDRPDGKLMLVAKCVDGAAGRLRVWDLSQPGPQHTVNIELLHQSTTVIQSYDGRLVHVFTADNRKLQSYLVTTGCLYQDMELAESVGSRNIGSVAMTDRYMTVLLTSGVPNGIRYSDDLNGTQQRYHIRPRTAIRSSQATGGILVIDVEEYVLVGRLSYCCSRTVAMSADNEYLACHVSPHSVAVHHLPGCQRLASLSLTADVVKLVFVPTSTATSNVRLCALTSDNSIMSLVFNLSRNQTAVTTVFHSVNDIDFRLSQTGNRMLISTKRVVYVADGVGKDVTTRQLRIPADDGGAGRLVNVEFLGASDVVVTGVVSGQCVVVWNALTTTVLRRIDMCQPSVVVLTSRLSPTLVITHNATDGECDSHYVKVSRYDLTDVQQDWLPAPTPLRYSGHVTHLAMSTTGNRFVACGSWSRDIVVGSLGSGSVERMLSGPAMESTVEKLCMSDRGRYAAVRWCLGNMPTDFVYNLNDGSVLYVTNSCCHTFFCPNESRIFFLLAASAEVGTCWSLRDFNPTSSDSGHTLLPKVARVVSYAAVAVPGSEQTYVALIAETSSDKVPTDSRLQRSLYICSGFELNRRKASVLDTTVLQPETLLLDVRPVTGSSFVNSPTVLVICKETDGPAFAALVDLPSQTVTRTFQVRLAPTDDVTTVLISRDGSVWVDRDFNVTLYDQATGNLTTALGCRSAQSQSDRLEPEVDKPERGERDICLLYDTAHLVLDGRVLVAMESNRRQMALYDLNTGQLISRVPLEGHGTVLRVANDHQIDTVLVVGCDDGRVASFAVIGRQQSDPSVAERILTLPSRLGTFGSRQQPNFQITSTRRRN